MIGKSYLIAPEMPAKNNKTDTAVPVTLAIITKLTHKVLTIE